MQTEPTRKEHSVPGFRADIEGLRAVAVVLVVLYHARIGPFDGGFVGVDVFFVLSGYLISSLLIREMTSTGAISLPRFWARRARRLLPAALLVVVVTLLLSRVVLDPLTQRDVTTDAFAATFFGSNFVFAFARTGYFASQLEPSPLLHFWSLAVEEQFYLLWPLLFFAISYYAPAARRLRVARVSMAMVWLVSFAACVAYSSRTTWAFYMLPTRAWELATGGLIATGVPLVRRITRPMRSVAAWAALVVLVLTAVEYDESTVFPGMRALAPVGATAVLVALCDTRGKVGPSLALSHPVLQWIGARSYSIYLWHWPLLVFSAAQWGALSLPARALVVAVSVALAAASYSLVENPIRHHPLLTRSSERSLRVGGALLAVAGAAVLISVSFPQPLTGTGVAASPALAAAVPTSELVPIEGVAASTTAPANDTVSGSQIAAVRALRDANYAALANGLAVGPVPGNLSPPLDDVRSNQPEVYTNGCHLVVEELEPRTCVYGDQSSATHVLLFGDSHAAQWFPAMKALAETKGWKLDVMTKSGCPTAAISQNNQLRDGRCDTWRANVVAWVQNNTPDLVVMTARAYGSTRGDVWTKGLTDTVGKMYGSAGRVLVLGDSPDMNDDVPKCLAEHLDDATACVTPRNDAVNTDVLEAERSVASQYQAMFEPTTDWVCTLDGCPVIVGNVLMYRDDNHLTTNAVLLLQPYLDAVLSEALAGG
jgi:peptidoglycan/LPS O-acetylase OafA/YrhL